MQVAVKNERSKKAYNAVVAEFNLVMQVKVSAALFWEIWYLK